MTSPHQECAEAFHSKQEQLNKIFVEAGISSRQILDISKQQSSPDVYKITTNEGVFALKIFSGHRNGETAESARTFYETAREHSISVPNIRVTEKSGAWILIEWLDGTLLHELPDANERYDRAIDTGKILRKIHEIKVGESFTTNRSSVDFLLQRIDGFIAKGCNPSLRDALQKKLNEIGTDPLTRFNNPSLLHGDITGGNIVVSQSGEISFFDPGEIIVGDPMSDLGYSQTSQCSPEFQNGILEGYVSKQSLSPEEEARFFRWRLIRQCVITYRAMHLKSQRLSEHISALEKLF